MESEPATSFSGNDYEVLFRTCHFDLRIPPSPTHGNDNQTENTAKGKNTRSFLYHGEKVLAYLVVAIHNTESIRWKLANALQRRNWKECAQGDLPLTSDEAELFFSKLRSRIVVYSAKVGSQQRQRQQQRSVPGLHNNTNRLPRTDSLRTHLGHNNSSSTNWYQNTLKSPASAYGTGASNIKNMITISSIPVFEFLATYDTESTSPSSTRLEDGSWQYMFPFEIKALDIAVEHGSLVDMALSFEIRTSCQALDDMLLIDCDEQAIDPKNYGDRSMVLEELATMLSSGSTMIETSVPGSRPDPMNTTYTESLPILPRRMFHAIVHTRPIVNIESRTINVPSGLKSTIQFVEIGITSDPEIDRTITIQSLHVKVPNARPTPIAPPSSTPITLTRGSVWRAVYKIQPLMDFGARAIQMPTIDSAMPNSNNPTNSKYTPQELDVNISVSFIQSNGEQQTLDAKFILNTPDQGLDSISRLDSSTLQEHVTIQDQIDSQHLVAPAQRRSQDSDKIFSAAPAPSFDFRYSNPPSQKTSNRSGHMKHMSLDIASHRGRIPASRRMSSVTFMHTHTLSSTGLTPSVQKNFVQQLPNRRSLSQKPRANTLVVASPRTANAQIPSSPLADTNKQGNWTTDMMSRNRSATIPNIGEQKLLLSPLYATADTQHTVPVTPQSAMLKPLPQIPTRTTRVSNASDQVYSILERDDAPSYKGEITVGFSAPSRVSLGEEVLVSAYVTNNTNAHFFHLSLMDTTTNPDSALYADDDRDVGTPSSGLISLCHSTDLFPLRPGGSTNTTLRYIAAEPHFHSVKLIRLLDMDSDASDKTLLTIESPFVIYVEE